MNEGFLLPEVDVDSAPFWEGTAAGELRVQTCRQCGARRFPPRPMCPNCRCTDSDWPALSGRGTIWSYVIPHPPLLPAYADLAPYNVVVVTLAEDPALRMVGNLIAAPDAPINSIDPETIEIGTPVTVAFSDAGDGIHLPRWVPAGV
jgi:uncharacterized OB-fold protein